jgi:hypothetical protein
MRKNLYLIKVNYCAIEAGLYGTNFSNPVL